MRKFLLRWNEAVGTSSGLSDDVRIYNRVMEP